MKILYIVPTFKRSGLINIVFNLVSCLIRQSHEIIILSLYSEPQNTRRIDFEKIGVKIICCNLNKYKLFTGRVYGLKRKIIALNPDIVHSHGLFPDIINGFFLKGKNRFCTIHNYFFDDYKMKFGPIVGKLATIIHFNAVKRISNPIACSKTNSALYKLRGLNVGCVQNGVETEENDINIEKQRKAKSTLICADQSKKIIISVGALIPLKNSKLLLSAFLLSHRKNDCTLVFLGSGELFEDLKEMSKDYSNCVILMGNVINVSDFYEIADLFVTASKSEGLPTAVLEAMSHGISIIASDIPQHKEIFEADNNACTFFSSGNMDDLVAKLDSLDLKKLDKPNIRIENILVNNFSAKVMASKYLELYCKVYCLYGE
jgi:glycosyltransferase involved in cell wall biosynthesis